MIFYITQTFFCQSTNGSWRSVKLVDFMFVNHIPKTSVVGKRRNAFKNNRRCTTQKWTINDVSMSRNPTDVGGAPINISIFVSENILKRSEEHTSELQS